MTYSEFLNVINENADEPFALFQKKLIPTKYTIVGVRTPMMRKLAQAYKNDTEEILSFPNEYYEVVFIKLALIAELPYERFLERVEYAVSLMDNWALCDCFKARCIKTNKEEFSGVLEELFLHGGEFYERYVLVTLLARYVDEEKYLPMIESYLRRADASKYYVYMAIAWLTAEIIVKHYAYGLQILQNGILSPTTRNKAIQKAIESYRLTEAQKTELRSLKIKKTKQ